MQSEIFHYAAAYEDLKARVLSALDRDVSPSRPLELHTPTLDEDDVSSVVNQIRSGFVSSVGSASMEFGDAVAAFAGVRHAIPIVNGTAALQLALQISGVRPGQVVLVPALSFIATANAVRHLGAKPVFVDIDPIGQKCSLGMSVEDLSRVLAQPIENLACVVPAHILGRLASRELPEIANANGLKVIEDAAEALGSVDGDGRHSGSGAPAVLSFNGNKIITTGGGGAILTNDDQFAERARHLSTTAKVTHPFRFSHDEIGYNYRLPALNAALGLSQMQKLPEHLRKKSQLARSYDTAFKDSEHFEFLQEPDGQTTNNWLCAVRLRTGNARGLELILEKASSDGLWCRPLWDLLPFQAPYLQSSSGQTFPNAKAARDSIICLPSSPNLMS